MNPVVGDVLVVVVDRVVSLSPFLLIFFLLVFSDSCMLVQVFTMHIVIQTWGHDDRNKRPGGGRVGMDSSRGKEGKGG